MSEKWGGEGGSETKQKTEDMNEGPKSKGGGGGGRWEGRGARGVCGGGRRERGGVVLEVLQTTPLRLPPPVTPPPRPDKVDDG